eukprot:TRINITY_DN95_c0_g1_i1.p1 TRINITY_DN95_c0_g1~~TRINITY_DN95_c0_g1_i1.p1  ORF type:complete len:638 (-),score=322.13 TRINITY_DN95_c0_g1_i1:33-1946(-)
MNSKFFNKFFRNQTKFTKNISRLNFNNNNNSSNGQKFFRFFSTKQSLLNSFKKSSKFFNYSLFATGLISFYYLSNLNFETKAQVSTKAEELIFEQVGFENELKDGEMKELNVNGVKVLLSRVNGVYYATDLNCTHYGAPLNTGILVDDIVSCPWHNAQFSVKDGQVLAAPGMDPLRTYKVLIADSKIFIGIPKELKPAFQNNKGCSCSDKRTFIIIGGGAAGSTAVETLRQDGFKGKIILLTKDKYLPYDRPSLSKSMGGTSADKLLLRCEQFYVANQIDIRREIEVVSLNSQQKLITLSNGEILSYDKLLIASGSRPRTLNIPGSQLANVFTLRTVDDAINIYNAIKSFPKNNDDNNNNSRLPKIAIIGSSFIGMETAAAIGKELKNDVDSITIIGMELIPFERVLGAQVGSTLKKMHSDNDIFFKMNRTVSKIEGNLKVESLVLDNGNVLNADIIIVGAGAIPETSFINDIPKLNDGSLIVDSQMRVIDVKDNSVFAAGDIVNFPYLNNNVRVEHWAVAQNHGRIAAHSMVDKQINFQPIPFFWTRSWDTSLGYVGNGFQYDEVIIQGSLEERKFVAYYSKNDVVIAVASMGISNAIPCASELLRLNKLPTATQIKQIDSLDLNQLLEQVKQSKN